MKVSAIICEYNPFHNGHKYQAEVTKKITGCDAVVGLMSGNYVQRGDFAILPKTERASAAINCGIDLVLENPSYLTLKSAEGYAYSAVYTLNSLGCVDYLVFGCERDDIYALKKIAELFVYEDENFKKILGERLAEGYQFAVARSMAAEEILGGDTAQILKQPNNLLAIEYIKALLRLNSDIEPVAIKRIGTEHDAEASNGEYASASFIRALLTKGEDVSKFCPQSVADICKSKPFAGEKIDAAIISSLVMKSSEQLAEAPGIAEGLENKIKSELFNAKTLDELVMSVKSKRYAYSRIRRAIVCSYLGISKDESEKLPEYIKILEFNERGQKILNAAKKTSKLPLAKSASPLMKDKSAMTQWKRELERDRVYEILRSL